MKRILLADDDRDDQVLFELALTLLNSGSTLEVVSNGQQVLTYLDNCSGQLPSLIVLDYNMPKLTGADVIRAVYKQPNYQAIPIVVFSTSGSDHMVTECLREGAVKCFVKPNTMGKLVSTTEEMLTYCC